MEETVGEFLDALSGSEVNISGGTVGSNFDARGGSVVNISGGTVGNEFDAQEGSEVVISGGNVGQRFTVSDSSSVSISGGTVGKGFTALADSDVELSGGEFQLNGESFTESTINLAIGDVFTGTLSDGSAFIFAYDVDDRLVDVKLNQTDIADADLTPIFVSSSSPDHPASLRSGQTLTVEQDGVIVGEFEAVGGVVNVDGGSFEADTAFINSTVNLIDGSLDGVVMAYAGSEINVFDGTIDSLVGNLDSQINIFGGNFESELLANAGSAIDIFATEFFIDGFEVNFDDIDTPLLIQDRDVVLTGVFSDGSEFAYNVSSSSSANFFVSPDATFQLNLVAVAVPEPSASLLLAFSSMMLLGKRRRSR